MEEDKINNTINIKNKEDKGSYNDNQELENSLDHKSIEEVDIDSKSREFVDNELTMIDSEKVGVKNESSENKFSNGLPSKKAVPRNTLVIAYMAMFVALISVCSWISIPSTVPFTMQTFAVFCCLFLLGGKYGTFTVLVYIFLGGIGVPIFSNFNGGFGYIFGFTGGYMVGFILMGLVYLCATKLFGKKFYVEICAAVIGLLIMYIFGTVWVMWVYAKGNNQITFAKALMICVVPYLIPDIIKLCLAYILSKRLKRYVKI